MKNLLFLSLTILFFTSCSKVNVVLLPEENNKVGKIEIKNNDKTITMDKAYQQVDAIEGNSEILTREDVIKKFKESIDSLPPKPKSYLIYFKWDSPKILPTSNKILKKAIVEAKKDSTNYIEIIGHTDRAGDKKYNKTLSLNRAKNMLNVLVKKGIPKEKISIDYYGESNPIAQTRDGVARKVNRRVEIIIK